MFICAGGMGLLLGTIVPNKQIGMAIAPVTIIPFMLFAGFFVSQDNIPPVLIPFQYISIFKFAMQALMQVSSI